MKKLNVVIQCMAVCKSSIEVPDNLNINEAVNYAREHINEIPIGTLEYVSDSDELDEMECYFEE